MPVTLLDLPREVVHSSRLLDRYRDAVHAWSLSLFDPVSGGYRQSDSIGVNVLASTDVAWIRYATNDPDPGAPDLARQIAYLERAQDPESGEVCHDRGPGGQGHSDAHAFWQAARAARLIGATLPRMPARLRPLARPAALADWFDERDWSAGGTGHHHEVLGLVPLVASLLEPALTDTLLRKIGEQQDPRTGTWPRGARAPDVSRTFAYTAIHLAAGRLPERANGIVDAILDAQRGNGLWDLERPHFHTMDAAYLLVRLPPRIGHREAEAGLALRALSEATRSALVRDQVAYASNPHAVLALTHTLGLLQEALPADYPSRRRYRFDWDRLAQYACDAIRRELRSA